MTDRMTACGCDEALVRNWLASLVSRVYKILPIRENNEQTLGQYMKSLQREMLGTKALIQALDSDGRYMSVISIIQYMIDYPCDIAVTRSEVFKAIDILKKLIATYTEGGERDGRMGSV